MIDRASTGVVVYEWQTPEGEALYSEWRNPAMVPPPGFGRWLQLSVVGEYGELEPWRLTATLTIHYPNGESYSYLAPKECKT